MAVNSVPPFDRVHIHENSQLFPLPSPKKKKRQTKKKNYTKPRTVSFWTIPAGIFVIPVNIEAATM